MDFRRSIKIWGKNDEKFELLCHGNTLHILFFEQKKLILNKLKSNNWIQIYLKIFLHKPNLEIRIDWLNWWMLNMWLGGCVGWVIMCSRWITPSWKFSPFLGIACQNKMNIKYIFYHLVSPTFKIWEIYNNRFIKADNI